MRVIRPLTILAFVLSLAACEGDPMTSEDGGGGLDAAAPPGDADVELCAADSECDDGLFCNGLERCLPGGAGSGADGCVAGTAPCDAAAGETCDEEADTCAMGGCEGDMADLDGDGDDRIECGGSDCDDGNPDVFGTAQEICDEDGVDEDCDPSTIHDDTPTTGDGDADGDGFVDDACFNERADGGENRGDDCDDGSADIRPGVLDGCDGVDTDCDGTIDEDPDRTFYEDIDGDGFGVVSSTTTACAAPPAFAVMPGDCDDGNRNINPSAGEPCNGIDDDCSGVADDPAAGSCSCVDGRTQSCGPTTDVGACTFGTSTCVAGEWGPCVGAVDRMPEICNGADDDCDGDTDDADADIATGDRSVTGADEWWRDGDGDGYGRSGDRRIACMRPSGYVATTMVADCADGDGMINPGRVEECNGVDDNCVMGVDEGCDCTDGMTRMCPDGSNVGDCSRGMQSCSGGRWGACTGRVEPGTEVCGGGDEDCDGMANDADPDISGAAAPCPGGASEYWRDMDGDGVGTDTDAICACVRPSGYVSPGAEPDCDDTEMTAHPGLMESETAFPCDTVDNDCDGVTDEAGTDALECFPDADGDGYGDEGATGLARCFSCPTGMVADRTDCRDDIADVHPDISSYHDLPACPTGQSYGFCMRAGGALTIACGSAGPCSSATPEWDYDCSGLVETEPTGTTCRASGMFCVGERGPESGVTGADCGLQVTYVGGCTTSSPTGGFACSMFTSPDSSEALGCR